MSEGQSKERARKVLEIALDMHQAKEIRMQAVRVLKALGAIDELWTVVQNVRCPFTKQSAIDLIPALESKAEVEQTSEPVPITENKAGKEEEKEVAAPLDRKEYQSERSAAMIYESTETLNHEALDATKKLLKYGVTSNDEAGIYLMLVKGGPKRLSEIANHMNLDAAKTYHLLSALQNKGMVNATFKHPVQYAAVPMEQF